MLAKLLQNKLGILWLGFFTGMVFLGNFVLPGMMAADSEIIENMRDGVIDAGDGSFAATALFFSFFPKPLDVILLLAIGWVSLGLMLYKLKTPQAYFAVYLMTFPAIISAMIRPQKEIIVIILAICVTYIVMYTEKSKLMKLLIIMGMYAVYAAVFRSYYFLIIFTFICTFVFAKASVSQKVCLVLVGIALLLMTPVEILVKLQGQRDLMNYVRVSSGEAGHRTAFMNPYLIDSLWHFILNYVHAILRMHTPIIFDFGIKSIGWMGIASLYAYALLKGAWQKWEGSDILFPLFMAHLLVLMLFEPDIGTYIRHITSVFLYVLPGILALDKSWQKKGKSFLKV